MANSNWKCVAVLAACSFALVAAVPQGWYLAGSNRQGYESDTDAQAAYNGSPSAYLKAKKPDVEGFGTLMQNFRADKYFGMRVRFSAFVKAEGVARWAGLWMRIDKGSKSVAFDNMQNRLIKGTTGWRRYEVVLDVPQDSTGIFFGILLDGPGTVWLNSVKFEVVGTDVPTTELVTGKEFPDEPTNLSFEK